MPRATDCKHAGKIITVDDAIKRRDDANRDGRVAPQFSCRVCGKAVRPFRAGTQGAAHFEHHQRNPGCERSDPAR